MPCRQITVISKLLSQHISPFPDNQTQYRPHLHTQRLPTFVLDQNALQRGAGSHLTQPQLPVHLLLIWTSRSTETLSCSLSAVVLIKLQRKKKRPCEGLVNFVFFTCTFSRSYFIPGISKRKRSTGDPPNKSVCFLKSTSSYSLLVWRSGCREKTSMTDVICGDTHCERWQNERVVKNGGQEGYMIWRKSCGMCVKAWDLQAMGVRIHRQGSWPLVTFKEIRLLLCFCI